MRQSYKSNYKQVRFVCLFSFCFVLLLLFLHYIAEKPATDQNTVKF